jgi:8-oxo-dGTP diphosphatase
MGPEGCSGTQDGTFVRNRATPCERIPREYPPVPLIGVGAVIVQGSRSVLVRRGRPPSLGQWSIPGGLVEVGETLKRAVAREALEETGLVVEPCELIEVLERIFPDDQGLIQYHYVLADYLCKVTGGELRAGSDATDAIWMERKGLADLAIAPVTLEIIAKAFDLAGHYFRESCP